MEPTMPPHVPIEEMSLSAIKEKCQSTEKWKELEDDENFKNVINRIFDGKLASFPLCERDEGFFHKYRGEYREQDANTKCFARSDNVILQIKILGNKYLTAYIGKKGDKNKVYCGMSSSTGAAPTLPCNRTSFILYAMKCAEIWKRQSEVLKALETVSNISKMPPGLAPIIASYEAPWSPEIPPDLVQLCISHDASSLPDLPKVGGDHISERRQFRDSFNMDIDSRDIDPIVRDRILDKILIDLYGKVFGGQFQGLRDWLSQDSCFKLTPGSFNFTINCNTRILTKIKNRDDSYYIIKKEEGSIDRAEKVSFHSMIFFLLECGTLIENFIKKQKEELGASFNFKKLPALPETLEELARVCNLPVPQLYDERGTPILTEGTSTEEEGPVPVEEGEERLPSIEEMGTSVASSSSSAGAGLSPPLGEGFTLTGVGSRLTETSLAPPTGVESTPVGSSSTGARVSPSIGLGGLGSSPAETPPTEAAGLPPTKPKREGQPHTKRRRIGTDT